MIEAAMLMAFGFCAATLVALAILPFVTRRSARLAAERLQDLAPLSPDEIAAERDGLRAVAAVEQRRLERKLAEAEAIRAERDAVLGQRAAELASLQETREAEAAARAALAAALQQAEERHAALETRCAELQGRLDQAFTRLRAAEEQGRAAGAKRDEFEALAEERRGTIASLETRYAGLDMRRGDLEDELTRVRAEQAKLRDALTAITRERDLSRNEVQLVATQRAMLQDDLTEANRRADKHRLRAEAKAEALVKAERKLMTETADREAAESALADLKRRFERLEARLIEQGGKPGEPDDGALDALRTEVIAIGDQALDVLGQKVSRGDDTGADRAPAHAADEAGR